MPRDHLPVDHRLIDYLCRVAGAERIDCRDFSPLLGGAVMRHFLLDLEVQGGRFAGRQRWVLRMEGETRLGIGLPRAQEFALQRVLFAAGRRVAEPLFVCCDERVLGAPFFIMRWVAGEAKGSVLAARPANDALAMELGTELGALHAADWTRRLHFLPAPPSDAAAARIAELEGHLAADNAPHPVAEWALRWLKREKPAPASPTLCHGDFRTGNYLVEEGRLAAILDWDFACWSDPDEDIAWFCAKAWRYGAWTRDAGGIAARGALYRGYEPTAHRHIDPDRVRYWEVMAALRWLVIALKQRDRFLKQGEESLDLALTGRRPAECELEILLLTDPPRALSPDPVWASHAARCNAPIALRDRPSGEELTAVAARVGGAADLVARAHAIAARERQDDAKGWVASRAALWSRYGEGDDSSRLARLAAEVRDGGCDVPSAARDGIMAMLWEMTRQKLRESHPEFLAANGPA